MRGLSAADVVAVWERGQERHPVDRALLLRDGKLTQLDRAAGVRRVAERLATRV